MKASSLRRVAQQLDRVRWSDAGLLLLLAVASLIVAAAIQRQVRGRIAEAASPLPFRLVIAPPQPSEGVWRYVVRDAEQVPCDAWRTVRRRLPPSTAIIMFVDGPYDGTLCRNDRMLTRVGKHEVRWSAAWHAMADSPAVAVLVDVEGRVIYSVPQVLPDVSLRATLQSRPAIAP